MDYRQPFTKDYAITQYYGDKYTSAFHTGIDYSLPPNTEVLASESGTVMQSGWMNGGWGNCVIIQHPDGNATLYAHLNKCLVKVGDQVVRGQVIGLSGSTGNSTGPHLHFETRKVWNDYKSHFNPMLLPLHTVDDSLPTYTEQVKPIEKELLPRGVCEIDCSEAWVRDWGNIQRSYTVKKGTKVYVFDDVKWCDDLPFRYIGANRCIAEYDYEGTVILKKV